MNVLRVQRRFLGIIPYTVEIPKPHIYLNNYGLWECRTEGMSAGFGRSPYEAWNDWAMRALI
jgi:hypothetical protein